MSKTTLANMLKWIEQPFQTTVSRERDLLVTQANKIRRMFYDMYREFEMEVDVQECFRVQSYGHCSGCPDDARGFTLPPYMQNVEAAWLSSEPLLLYSKWREYKVGRKPSSDALMAVYDMPGSFPTERDLCPFGCLHSVQFMAKCPSDAGKKVKVEFKSTDGREEEYVELVRSGYTKMSKGVYEINAVVLPTDLKGGVVIAQSDDSDKLRILSEYQPWEHVPSYRRVKVTGAQCDEAVVVTASRQYTDLYYDDDIVETDNRIAIENAARFLFYSESGTGQDLMQKAAFHLEIAKDALRGMNSRDIGVGKEGDLAPSQPARRSRLHRNRRSHTIR